MTRVALVSGPRWRRRRRRVAGQDNRVLAAVVLGLAVLAGGHTIGRAAPADPAVPAVDAAQAAATPFRGGDGARCALPDPTAGRGGSGCVTPVTAHGLAEVQRVFGPVRGGSTITSAGCWDAHAWNPTSDHPKGRACDFFFGKAGAFPAGAPLAHGWALARWLRANETPLHVRYVIWQGRIWQADDDRDVDGWGKPYRGGGVYDPGDATGGHFDHVHVSFSA